MQLSRISLASTLVLATTLSLASVPAVAYMHARRGPTAHGLFKKRADAKAGKSAHTLGPRAMDSERATQIQSALIKSGYLSGSPSGHWDTESEAAMQKLQGNNGWQTKLTPDSRALILLGLGPKQDSLATAETTDFSDSKAEAGSTLVAGAGTKSQ